MILRRTTALPRVTLKAVTFGAMGTALAGALSESWERDGYFRVNGFLSATQCENLLRAANSLLHHPDNDVVIRFEDNLPDELPAERRISKLYRFHRRGPFRQLCTSPELLALVQPLIGGDVDVFLSQVVWKVPGAHGQPWHQDASVFPFEPERPVVAVWLALTRAADDNSCLRLVPGSQRSPLLRHGFDRQSPTGARYLSLADRRVDGWEPVIVGGGDLVVFDSHLVHASTDNISSNTRVALTFHFASAGTIDRTVERFGESPYNDWMPAFRR